MTDKENALRIIRFDQPHHIAVAPPCHTLAYLGCNHESADGGGGHDVAVGTSWTDVWGTVWQKLQPGVMGFPQHHPIDSLEAFRAYRWPDQNDFRFQKIYDDAAKFDRGADQFLSGSHRETLWEKAYMLAGMENMMDWLLNEPALAQDLLQHIMDFNLLVAQHHLKAGIEIAFCGDDLGTQCAPLLAPDLIREMLVPQYRRLFSLYKEHNVLIWFHSCGHIEELIPIFLDLGIDILNPVQASANNLDKIRALTQGKMALHGGVSSGLMVSGPPESIAAEVRLRMKQLGSQGGYFCNPDQGMPWPQEHYNALWEAVQTYGVYPLV